jgi:spermidine/putrescine transport system ATP-binding protein
MTMADTIAVMRAGKIEQLGPPAELYERPATAFVAGFLGASNLLPGTIEGSDAIRLDDGTLLRASVDGRSGEVAAGVRPEKITIGAGGGANELPGTISETAYIGVATQVVVRTAAGTVHVFAQNMDAGGRVPTPGTTVVLSWAPESTFVVDREGSDNQEEDG